MAAPIVAIVDTFDRADEGPPPSASWVNSSGSGLQVASNQCRAATVNSDASTWNTAYAESQEVGVVLSALQTDGNAVALLGRQATANDYLSAHYEVDWVHVAAANDIATIWKRTGGAWTQLGADVDLGGELTANDVLGMQLLGSTILVFRNGALIASRTDTAVTGSGYPGLYVSDTTARLDSFRAGSVASHVVPGSVAGGHLVGGALAR